MTTETQLTPEEQQQQEAQAEADFAKGLSSVRGGEKPAEKPEEKAPEKPVEAAKEPPKDEWEGVPPKVREEIEALRAKDAEREKLAARVRNAEGHIGNLTSKLKAAEEAAKAAREKKEPTPEEVAAAEKARLRKTTLKEDLPDVAEEIDEIRKEMSALPKSQINAEEIEARILAEAEKRIAQAREDAQREARKLAPIDVAHPRWEVTISSPEFISWEKKQSQEIQAIASSDNPLEVIRMLDLYAAEQKKAAQKAERKERLESAITPRGQPTVPDTTESDEEAFRRGLKRVRGG